MHDPDVARGFTHAIDWPIVPAPFPQERPMIQRIDAGPRMSEASIHNGVAYLAGQVPETDGADIETQTREVLEAIDALLAQAGSDKTRILRAQIFLADIADFAGMNRAWDAWVVAGNAPSRATVEAKLARPEWKVEIVVTAAV
jgi:enamine deaminase RidA (YjgF/YER057c/UK114 family)